LSTYDEGSAHSFNLKSHILHSEEIDFPWSTCGLIEDEQPARLLCSPSVIVVMQPIHNSHVVDLPAGLDLSRFW